jgi:hypothetical protein
LTVTYGWWLPKHRFRAIPSSQGFFLTAHLNKARWCLSLGEVVRIRGKELTAEMGKQIQVIILEYNPWIRYRSMWKRVKFRMIANC